MRKGFDYHRRISIHAPRVGSDWKQLRALAPAMVFQSTLPVWGATSRGYSKGTVDVYFNPHSPCGERRKALSGLVETGAISIHAPRVGSDSMIRRFNELTCISIHAPRVGSDFGDQLGDQRHYNFNPRSPCGERRKRIRLSEKNLRFQSTLPVWGATGKGPNRTRGISNFNPRSPCGERHKGAAAKERLQKISIHAPRVGSDHKSLHGPHTMGNFNPRSPCGERRTSIPCPCVHRVFQSTLPVWGATDTGCPPVVCPLFQSTLPVWGATEAIARSGSRYGISIHAPRVGSDEFVGFVREATIDFNPRSPCGERPVRIQIHIIHQRFQSTLPVWGATKVQRTQFTFYEFQSTLPVWGATQRPQGL